MQPVECGLGVSSPTAGEDDAALALPHKKLTLQTIRETRGN